MIKEFFGFGPKENPYGGTPDGYLSWQHLVFVSVFVAAAIGLAIFLGLRNKNKPDKTKNAVLIWTAIIIDTFEIVKIIIGCTRNPSFWRISLPLFLCSLQLIAIPLAAFTKGRVKEAALDFVVIFGMLGGMIGVYGMASNYNMYPTVSWPNFVSAVTHSMAGFAGLYIILSGMASMKKKNIPFTFIILFGFAVLAYVANLLLDYNYMFLMYHDGTPYLYFYNLVNGNRVLYPLMVMLLFVLYICVFYLIYIAVKNAKEKKSTAKK